MKDPIESLKKSLETCRAALEAELELPKLQRDQIYINGLRRSIEDQETRLEHLESLQ
jgi:hypothetical protein